MKDGGGVKPRIVRTRQGYEGYVYEPPRPSTWQARELAAVLAYRSAADPAPDVVRTENA